jgi:hypothetical protein
MDEDLEALLRRVAAGEISPEAAEPLVAALTGARREAAAAGPARSAGAEPSRGATPEPPGQQSTADGPPPSSPGARGAGRAVRIQVTEGGKMVVNLRVPMSWTGLTSLVPGLSDTQAARVSEALRVGERGRILDLQDARGDGVVISTE